MNAYLGYLAGVMAMICFSSLAIFVKKVTTYGLEGVPLIFINAVMLSSLSLIAVLILPQTDLQIIKKIDPKAWVWVGVYSVVNFIALASFIWCVQRINPTEYQIMFLASPIVVALLAYLLFNEPFQLKHLVGGIVVAIGVLISIKGNF
jgi:drug/metabolite transporter (DMT)-like permease